jgi:hypothetical protein
MCLIEVENLWFRVPKKGREKKLGMKMRIPLDLN